MCTPDAIRSASIVNRPPGQAPAEAQSPAAAAGAKFPWGKDGGISAGPADTKGIQNLGKNLSAAASKVPQESQTVQSAGPGVASTGTESYRGTIGAAQGAAASTGKRSVKIARK